MKCEKCGNEHDGSYGSGRFCSKECARGFSGSNRSFESRKKTSISVSKEHKHICIKCGKEFMSKGTGKAICLECKALKPKTQYDSNGKRIVSEITRRKISLKAKERVANGTHVGWKIRPVESYSEKFWKQVLLNNNIEFEFNFYIQKKSLGLSDLAGYFLDFKLQNKIDLEIDGKQHKYEDRKQSDLIRDKALSSNGWKIYRVEWNEINSINGKNLMKKKIDDFLSWYKLNR